MTNIVSIIDMLKINKIIQYYSEVEIEALTSLSFLLLTLTAMKLYIFFVITRRAKAWKKRTKPKLTRDRNLHYISNQQMTKLRRTIHKGNSFRTHGATIIR